MLNEWSKRYSIYELYVDDGGDPDDADLDMRAERLPGPPALRLEIPADEPP